VDTDLDAIKAQVDELPGAVVIATEGQTHTL
jgi:hypothetical protein